MSNEEKVFQEVDVFSLLKEIGSKSKIHQAKVLQMLEEHIKDKEEFSEIRKFFLDEQNSFTRAVVRIIFGDIEFLHFPNNKKR